MSQLNVVLLSPYHSGSHKAWATAWQKYTRHNVNALTLPGRFWKWRMQGAAVTLARRFMASDDPADIIVADDLVDLTTFLALTRRRTATIPVLLYMHENQLTYPLPDDPKSGPMRRNWGVRERAYGLINWKAMLAADAVWFNSHFHLNSWFDALPSFLNHYPEEQELETIPLLRAKSSVMPVGVDPPRRPAQPVQNDGPPLIIWNQRWEFDKNPAGFVNALREVKIRDIPFQLALCGERFHLKSPLLADVQETFRKELVYSGFAERDVYESLLYNAALTVSTAHHEFFGIGTVEAMMAHTLPLLPRRLSYPELIPPHLHAICLYDTSVQLVNQLCWALSHPAEVKRYAGAAAIHAQKYAASKITVQFDQNLSQLTRSS